MSAADLKVVHHRVDALQLGFRVDFETKFVAMLERRGRAAKKSGRAAFEWSPPPELVEQSRAKGSPGTRWAAPDRAPLSGELRLLRSGSYLLTREPYFYAKIDMHGPGGEHVVDDVTGEVHETPGWTLDVVWYADTLARWGLLRCLVESYAIAWSMGRVLEACARRIDLCADVAGWEITPGDEDAMVKRPRAGRREQRDGAELLGHRKLFGAGDDVASVEGPPRLSDLGRGVKTVPCKPFELAGAITHDTGRPGHRKLCGITIGTGGAVMCRTYDKPLELGYDVRGDRREAEYARFREGGWDGVSPVTRVEFQIRGAAMRELGLRDPEAVREAEYDADGRPCAHTIVKHEDGRTVDLVDRLPWVWRTMLEWCRLVVPDASQKYTSRLGLDPRWKLLHAVRFGDACASRPIRRCRVRGAASEAQALGVALSQAARAGELDAVKEWKEGRNAYDVRSADQVLTERIGWVTDAVAPRVKAWLLRRCNNDPVEALVHFARIARAKQARFAAWKGDEFDDDGRAAIPSPQDARRHDEDRGPPGLFRLDRPGAPGAKMERLHPGGEVASLGTGNLFSSPRASAP